PYLGVLDFVRLRQQLARTDFVELIVSSCTVDECDFIGVIDIVLKDRLSFLKTQVSAQTRSSVQDVLLEFAIKTDGKDVVVNERETCEQYTDGNRIEESELRS